MPYYWRKEYEETSRQAALLPNQVGNRGKAFLNDDFCAINNEDFFVRGLIQLPIIGTARFASPRQFRRPVFSGSI